MSYFAHCLVYIPSKHLNSILNFENKEIFKNYFFWFSEFDPNSLKNAPKDVKCKQNSETKSS